MSTVEAPKRELHPAFVARMGDGKRSSPREEVDVEGAWSLADFGSACPTRGLDAGSRMDPYWDGLWSAGSSGSWASISLARQQQEVGLGRLPKGIDLPEDEASVILRDPSGWADRLSLLGSLFAWRTMTAEQAAAFTGARHLASPRDPSIAALFSSEILDLGGFAHGLFNTGVGNRGALYRTGRGYAFERKLMDRMTWAEWLSVTGGQSWSPSSSYDRHNVLATELGLRTAEFCEVGTVLGERFSNLDLLAGSAIGLAPLSSARAADLTVVRPDGLRVAFEVTASTGVSQHLYKKVRRWAQLLSETPFESSGLSVLFVVAQRPEELYGKNAGAPRSAMYQAIAAACREFPGSSRDRTSARMGVATWREWFPARGLVSDAFFGLRAWRPTGSGDGLWERADFLDAGSVGFDPADPEAMRAVISNAAILGGTPHWLRGRAEPPELWPLLLRHAEMDSIPQPTPVRPNRSRGATMGKGVGAAGDAKPPPRLLGLPRSR
ncbi:MAG: hypothetical protein ACRCYU_23555 [Nocardioides sp.]